MLRLTLIRTFLPADVTTEWVPCTRREVPAVEAAIDEAWRETTARPGVRLFDGPICRFESASVVHGPEGDRLTVGLSRTGYRVFVGTNFAHPEFADEYGPDVMANGLGVSTGLVTADGFWVMGRRNASVAYYPRRVHPFAGSLEVAERVDLFENARRELREELVLPDADVADVLLVGMAEDLRLRHPETVFFARTPRTLVRTVAGVDRAEHDGHWSAPATPYDTRRALASPDLTPIARAVLLLGGRHLFGDVWFAAARDATAPGGGAALPLGWPA